MESEIIFFRSIQARLHHAMKLCWDMGGIPPQITQATNGEVFSIMLWVLSTQGKNSWQESCGGQFLHSLSSQAPLKCWNCILESKCKLYRILKMVHGQS